MTQYSLFSIGVTLLKMFKNDSKFTIFDRGYLIENTCSKMTQNSLFSIGVTIWRMFKNDSKFTIFDRGYPIQNGEK